MQGAAAAGGGLALVALEAGEVAQESARIVLARSGFAHVAQLGIVPARTARLPMALCAPSR
jgi:hypothetical protein